MYGQLTAGVVVDRSTIDVSGVACEGVACFVYSSLVEDGPTIICSVAVVGVVGLIQGDVIGVVNRPTIGGGVAGEGTTGYGRRAVTVDYGTTTYLRIVSSKGAASYTQGPPFIVYGTSFGLCRVGVEGAAVNV
jgi:hypothetical protein